MPNADPAEGSLPEPVEEPEPPSGLAIDVVHEAGDWASLGDFETIIRPVLSAIGTHSGVAAHLPAEACVALVDDAAMRRMNATFRGKDKATNVLSFPAPPSPGDAGQMTLGDIALGFETVLREAAEQSVTPQDHIRHLVLHGMLHLMGYDHETDADAEVMEALEIEILSTLGIANPYEEAAAVPTED